MELQFIGTGSAFSKRYFNSNMVIRLEGLKNSTMLIDCGRTAPEAILAAGMSWKDIDGVYISHAHSDHAGGLEEFAFSRMFVYTDLYKPALIGNPDMLDDLWDKTLRGGLQPGVDRNFSLNDYFFVYRGDDYFYWIGVKFRMIKLPHIMPSYGLFIETAPESVKNKNVFITTDTQFDRKILSPWYDKSDIIFHDCETSKNKSGVHTHYDDLKNLPESIKKKMWLYHYQDDTDLSKATSDGFLGFVKVGQTFKF